jgi:hypothetical protein
MPENSPAAIWQAIVEVTANRIERAVGVEFSDGQRGAIKRELEVFCRTFNPDELPKLLKELESALADMQSPEIQRLLKFSEFLSKVAVASGFGTIEEIPDFKKFSAKTVIDLQTLQTKVRDFDKWRVAHARSSRSGGLREQTIAQGIAEKTKDWDGEHHFKKAEEIHGAINAGLKNAGLKTTRGAPQTISVKALSRRLKRLKKINS